MFELWAFFGADNWLRKSVEFAHFHASTFTYHLSPSFCPLRLPEAQSGPGSSDWPTPSLRSGAHACDAQVLWLYANLSAPGRLLRPVRHVPLPLLQRHLLLPEDGLDVQEENIEKGRSSNTHATESRTEMPSPTLPQLCFSSLFDHLSTQTDASYDGTAGIISQSQPLKTVNAHLKKSK